MEQSRGNQRAIRNLEARIAEQVEQVAQAICDDRNAEQEVKLLYRLSSLLASLKVRDNVASSWQPIAQRGASQPRLASIESSTAASGARPTTGSSDQGIGAYC
jgi:hypothetical protein